MAEQVTPYGSWKSPIRADSVVSTTLGFAQIETDGDDIYWVENRPMEDGRYVVVRRSVDGQVSDITPPSINARTRVHEYGGGSFAVADGIVYASDFSDQRLYCHAPGAKPRPITPAVDMRYADGIIDRFHGRIICVREDHTDAEREAVNTLVSIDLGGTGDAKVLVSGNDFYSSPHLSPDGFRLAWLTWNHPDMPWDGAELWIGEIDTDGSLEQVEKVAGGGDESIFQPEWSPDGTLYFVSDRTGWWNLYRWRNRRIEPLAQMEAEFGLPQWIFGMSTYAFESPHRIICAYTMQGVWHLASLDPVTGELEPIETPYTEITFVRAFPGGAVFLAGSFDRKDSVVQLDLATGEFEVLRHGGEDAVDPGYLSRPEAIEFSTEHGHKAHGFYYPPVNRDYGAPPGELPPLVVKSHGGPTGATTTSLQYDIQYLTSRGIAVLDVNYGGSTGYGRSYRQRLDGQWGIVDVDDCVNGARYLVERGLVDAERLAITGGSAGGYTTLCALTFRSVFKAGASHFGVSDLESLAKETHKFESRYLDRLVGPYPERRDLYVERSPIHSVDRLSCPIIFTQGLEDRVVAPSQAEKMVEALRAKGLPVAYVAFEGEQHGYRRAESIKRALEVVLYFFSRVFGFQLADPIEPVKIENL
jgi:dipeptidyl aminopeptidase/acylaminoacyl peptidase